MNLRLQAENDLNFTLQDGESGFGFPVIIEDTSGHIIGNDVAAPFFCQTGRVNFIIDPDTGVQVEGNFAHVGARIRDLIDAGFDVDDGAKSWKITMPDVNEPYGGKIRSYKVLTPRVDHTLGITLLILGGLTRNNAANEAIISEIMEGLSGS